jgi:hypothetical protein
VVIAIAIAFFLGLTGTVYLSLRSPEIKVPDIVGKDMVSAESALNGAGLNIRKRASRYSPDAKPNTVLDQSPRAGDVIKEGQTIAVVVSRAPVDGEAQAAAQQKTARANGEDSNKSEGPNASGSSNDNSANDNKSNRNQNKNSNKNANQRNANTGNTNNANANTGNLNNANRNATNRNLDNGNININNHNVNSAANRNAPAVNANRRPPVKSTLPAVTRPNDIIRIP